MTLSLASVKTKFSHHLSEVSLPQCGCLFQPVHSSLQQPQTVSSRIVFTWRFHQYTFSHGSMKKRSTDIASSCSPTSRKCHQQKIPQGDQCWGASKNIILIHCFLKAASNTQSTSNLSGSLPSFDLSTV